MEQPGALGGPWCILLHIIDPDRSRAIPTLGAVACPRRTAAPRAAPNLAPPAPHRRTSRASMWPSREVPRARARAALDCRRPRPGVGSPKHRICERDNGPHTRALPEEGRAEGVLAERPRPKARVADTSASSLPTPRACPLAHAVVMVRLHEHPIEVIASRSVRDSERVRGGLAYGRGSAHSRPRKSAGPPAAALGDAQDRAI